MKKAIIAISILVLISSILFAQDEFDPETKLSREEIVEVVKAVKEDSVAAATGFDKFVEKMEKIEGLFTFYRDNETGEVYLELTSEQLDKDYLCK
ncbi:DUF5118 domain-containing protein [Candidatus Cloacimonadota bacterium]